MIISHISVDIKLRQKGGHVLTLIRRKGGAQMEKTTMLRVETMILATRASLI